MSIYRDALAGLKSQVATKRGVFLSREGALSPIRRALVPKPLMKRIAEYRPLAMREEEEVGTLTAAENALDALLGVYDEIDALGPTIRECPFDVADPPRPAQAPPWLEEFGPQRLFRERLTAVVQRVAPAADVLRWGDHTYLARIRVDGAPLILRARVQLEPMTLAINAQTMMLRTSVPDGLGRLELGPSAPVLHAVGKFFGLVADREVGDAAFDAAFVVEGDDGVAAILGPRVRNALYALGDARLVLVRGVCEVTWVGPPSADILPAHALEALIAIRDVIDRA